MAQGAVRNVNLWPLCRSGPDSADALASRLCESNTWLNITQPHRFGQTLTNKTALISSFAMLNMTVRWCLFGQEQTESCTIGGMSDAENAALVIKEGVAQLFRPFQELLQQLLGPAATEVGGSLGDSLKMWRLGRQIKLLEKVKEMTKGKHINAVAPRLFFPILEAASIEADDDMQTRWAALLANEAIKVNSVHPSFVEILKQMSPEDARLLEKLYDWCKANNTSRLRWWLDSTLTLDEREKDTLENLFSLGFVETIYDFIQGGHRTTIVSGMPQLWSEDSKLDEQYMLTNTAFRFIEACRAPKCESSKTST